MLHYPARQFIKRADLVPGQVYLWKDGHLRWYLGQRGNTGELCFYTLARACLTDIYDDTELKHDITLLHEGTQVSYLQKYIATVINTLPYTANAYERYTTMPSIYGVFPCNASVKLKMWLARSNIKGITPTSKITTGSDYVSAKALVIGALYFSGKTPHRATYCYMGRDDDKNFVWLYIGNENEFKANPEKYINTPFYCHIERTKSNKQVRLLTQKWSKDLGDFRVNWSEDTLKQLY